MLRSALAQLSEGEERRWARLVGSAGSATGEPRPLPPSQGPLVLCQSWWPLTPNFCPCGGVYPEANAARQGSGVPVLLCRQQVVNIYKLTNPGSRQLNEEARFFCFLIVQYKLETCGDRMSAVASVSLG